MSPSEADLKEIFQLFTSVSLEEREAVYDSSSPHCLGNVCLDDEYELCEPKREYALDAWRAVLSFLRTRNYSLVKDGQVVDLSFIEDQFVK